MATVDVVVSPSSVKDTQGSDTRPIAERVTAYGQRGLPSTLAVEAGVTSRAVADALGTVLHDHGQSYAQPDALGRAKQARVIGVLDLDRSADGAGR